MSKPEKVAIGIDLGTSTCTVGVYQNGQVEIILNEGETRVSPNCIALTEEGKSVADLTKPREAITPAPKNAICDMMKMVGKCYYDKDMDKGMKMLPFKVVNEDGKTVLEVDCGRDTERRVTPVDLSTLIMAKVKEISEAYLGKPVDYVVLTVPVYFNEFERQAAKDAASKAGLTVLRIMNEPEAAALAYGFLHKEGKSNAIVFDLGGGTLDVSVFAIGNGTFDLKSTSGNTHLGGKDFDAVIVRHFANQFKSKRGIDVLTNPQAMAKLAAVAEHVKRCLSTYDNVAVKIESLASGVNFKSSLSRTKFEELNDGLFNSITEAIDNALDDANLKKDDISEIVLVGGSTRIPKIQSILKEYFCGKELTQTINPEEAIARGAAIQAAAIAKEETEKSKDVIFHYSPVSVGIKTAGGVMAIFVPRFTPLPCSFTHEFSTDKDNQPAVLIEVYEGEKLMAKDNNHLADLELSGLPPVPRGFPKIEVTFCIDRSGIIIVTARDRMSGAKNAIMITSTTPRLSAGVELEKTDESKSVTQIRNGLHSFCSDLLGAPNPLENAQYKVLTVKATDALKWLDNHPKATKEEIVCRQAEVEKCCEGAKAFVFRTCRTLGAGQVACHVDEPSEMTCHVDESAPEK